MSKGPTQRHSKPAEPVTIDLDATDVTPRDEIVAEATPEPSDDDREATAASPQDAPDAEDPGRPEAGGADETPAVSEAEPHRAAWPVPLIGGLAGGAVAFLVLYGLQAGGILPVPESGRGQAVSAHVAEIDARMQDLSRRVAQLPADAGASLAAVTGRLEALEQVVASVSVGAPNEAISDLERRVAALAERFDASATSPVTESPPENPADSAAISALQAESDRLAEDVAALKAQTAAIDEKQAELQATLTDRIEQAEAKAEAPDREIDMARAIASSALKAAVDRGGPFVTELETFASVAPDDPAIAELRDLAATGVPTRAALASAFPDVAEQMIAASTPVPPDQGVVGRLLSSARSVVKVRRVGDVEGDSVEAIAARLETRLNAGELEAALAEWEALPNEAKEAAAGFGKDLAARARVEKLMSEALLPQPSSAASAN